MPGMTHRAAISINLGAGAPIEVVRQLIDDFDSICQFSGALQYRAAIAEAEAAILRRPAGWVSGRDFDDYFFMPYARGGVAAVPAAILAPALSRYLAENNVSRETTTTVESIRYSNPFEIVFGIGVVGLLVLQTIRDWSGRRRVNAAVAADVENTVNARKVIRDDLTRRFLDSDVPVSPQLLDDLLTVDLAGSMQALGDSQFTLDELEAPEDEDRHHHHEEIDD